MEEAARKTWVEEADDSTLDEAAADKGISCIGRHLELRLDGGVESVVGSIRVRTVGRPPIRREVNGGGGEELGPELIGIRERRLH